MIILSVSHKHKHVYNHINSLQCFHVISTDKVKALVGLICVDIQRPLSGGRLHIKMPFYQYRDSHVKDKTVSLTVLSLT